MNIPVNELVIKDTIGFSDNMCILETRKKDNNNRYFILANNLQVNLFDLLHSEGLVVGELLKDEIIEVVSNMVVHPIDEELDANHFIYSDYASITNRACDTYFEVYHVFTEKKYRCKGLTKEFISTVLYNIYKWEHDVGNETCIFAQAGISCEKYPYPVVDNEDEASKILDGVISFYEKCGFIEVNKISDFENSCNMYFAPDHASASVIEFYKKAWKNMYNLYLEKLDQNNKLIEKINKVTDLLNERD